MSPSSFAAIDAISRYAHASPKLPALIEPDGATLDYAEFWAQLEALSQRLQEAGVGIGERVAVLLPQGGLEVIAVAGVLNRHVCLPLKARTTVAEVESALRRSVASALIVSAEFEAEAEAALEMGLTVLIAISGEPPKNWVIRTSAYAPIGTVAHSEAILFLITSATTSDSKVVPLTAANLNAGNTWTRDSAQLVASDRLLLMVPLCHRIGFESTFAQFLAGGTVIATGGFDPAAYVRWLNTLDPTWYVCAPAVHQAALLQLRDEQLARPISLRLLQSAGAPLPNDVREQLEEVLRLPVLNGYGATEAHYIAIEALPYHGHIPNAAGRSCGLEIGIMDAAGTLLPCGEDGEIAARGLSVCSGYLDDPEANCTSFRDGWFRTGDLGRLDQEGNLYVTGRLKEMINRGGEKILPGEVDAVLMSHPAVLEAAAFAIPHPTLGEDVACAVVLRKGDDAQVSALELRRFATERLAPFKVPHRIYFVDQIPRGELGKPQRWVLAERTRDIRSASPTPDELNHHLQTDGVFFEKLHEIWACILDRNDLGYNEDFFEAGGDSLAAINMLAEVDLRFGCQTSANAASFLDEPTLENLTSLVGWPPPPNRGSDESRDIQIIPVRNTGTSRQLFCFPTIASEGLIFRRMATHLRGQMDVSIVRPTITHRSFPLFGIENEGREAAQAIRKAQPEGPYFLTGYCYGGVVAVEAARQLVLEGQDVRVILFDVPMPGAPGLLRDWRIWIDGARRIWHRLWTSEHPGLTRNYRRVSRYLVWSALVPFRRVLVPVENVSVVRWILEWSRFDHYPLYKARPVDAPFLHFLCMDEPKRIDAISRFGWRRIARGGIEEKFVPLDHPNILHESNLPEIVEVLLRWCGIHQEALVR